MKNLSIKLCSVAKDQIERQIYKKGRDKVWWQVRDQVWWQVRDQVWGQVWWQVWSQSQELNL
jgi:hypothetical protein